MAQEKLTFYGGLDTIGGVHILYSCGNKGIIFDLGLQLRGYFGGNVRAHSKFDLQQYLLTRSAPPVLPIYNQDKLEGLEASEVANLWGAENMPEMDDISVFVSHIHQDHMALLPYVNNHTKVFMHEDAYSTYRGVVVSGEYQDSDAKFQPLKDLTVIDFDDFSLQLIEVDHDSPGASGFILQSKEHTIAFTGDWRTHGRNSERMERFISLCKSAGVDVLITEGTTLRKENSFQEPEVVKEIEVVEHYEEVAKQAKGLVYVNILARNVERVADFIVKTKELGRTLVVDARTALLWHEAAVNCGIQSLKNHPSLNDTEVIKVLDCDQDQVKHLPYQTISLDEIIHNKKKHTIYLTQENTPMMAQLERQGEAASPSHYVHADGNPLTNRDPILETWLKEFRVNYHYCATGGHAIPQEISRLIKEINPKVVIPLHSIHPSIVDSKGVPKYCPAYGETISLQSLLAGYQLKLV